MEGKRRGGVVEVEKARLKGGGDIYESVSCDNIADKGKVRKPFQHSGTQYVATSRNGDGKAEAYRLIPLANFQGEPHKYGDVSHDILRAQPEGFYHGMLVRRGKKECVLVGPPVVFVARTSEDWTEEDPSDASRGTPVDEPKAVGVGEKEDWV